jgi:hypothetical protein
MKSCPDDDHKHNRVCAGHTNNSLGRILPVRSALILALAALTALIGAGLMTLGHRPDAQIVLSAAGIFAVATMFYDRIIDRN